MSTSVVVKFLSSNFISLNNFANLELSINGAAPLAPKAQNDLKISSRLDMVLVGVNWSVVWFWWTLYQKKTQK